MVLDIIVTSDEWLVKKLLNEDVFLNKHAFNDYLKEVISVHLKEYKNCESTNITLPDIVKKVERYNIHKLTVDGLSSLSTGYDDKRIIKISLSLKYVKMLFENYFNSEIANVPILVLKNDKQILFETLLEFIEKNLSKEFQNYLKTI